MSLIDDTPEEICYVWFDECSTTISVQDEIQTAVVNRKNIQIDVSSYSATFPTLLYTLPQSIEHRPSSLTVKSSSVESAPISPALVQAETGRRRTTLVFGGLIMVYSWHHIV